MAEPHPLYRHFRVYAKTGNLNRQEVRKKRILIFLFQKIAHNSANTDRIFNLFFPLRAVIIAKNFILCKNRKLKPEVPENSVGNALYLFPLKAVIMYSENLFFYAKTGN